MFIIVIISDCCSRNKYMHSFHGNNRVSCFISQLHDKLVNNPRIITFLTPIIVTAIPTIHHARISCVRITQTICNCMRNYMSEA